MYFSNKVDGLFCAEVAIGHTIKPIKIVTINFFILTHDFKSTAMTRRLCDNIWWDRVAVIVGKLSKPVSVKTAWHN